MGESDWTAPESWKSYCTLRNRGQHTRGSANGSRSDGGLYTTQSRIVRSTLDLSQSKSPHCRRSHALISEKAKELPRPPTSPMNSEINSKPILPALQPVRATVNDEPFPSSGHPIRPSPSQSEYISRSPESPFSCHQRRRAVSCEHLSKLVETVRNIKVPKITGGREPCHLRKWIAGSKGATDPPFFSSSKEKHLYQNKCALAATKIDIAISKATRPYPPSQEKQDFDPAVLYDSMSYVEGKGKEKAADVSSTHSEDDERRSSYDGDESDMDSDTESSCSSCTSSESIPIMVTATKATRLRPLPVPSPLPPKESCSLNNSKTDKVSVKSVSISSTLSPSVHSSPRSSLQTRSRGSIDTPPSSTTHFSPITTPRLSSRPLTPSDLNQIQQKFNRDRDLPPLPPPSPTRNTSPASNHTSSIRSRTPIRRVPEPVVFV
ncbi:hypothetical protein VKT23_008752 [Stygiomarasmius scandens]|uniref:Uncharacterized protein n=1 Tax=Marasmiellus scandens TaxID=2682957 RepID=A0ABR1JFH9_9AGAR